MVAEHSLISLLPIFKGIEEFSYFTPQLGSQCSFLITLNYTKLNYIARLEWVEDVVVVVKKYNEVCIAREFM